MSPNCSYLFTGGTRGPWPIDHSLAAEQGAKSIILASQSGKITPAVQALVDEVTTLKIVAQISVFRCDVRDWEKVQQLTDAYSENRPIRGVIHGIMVLRDTLFENSTLAD